METVPPPRGQRAIATSVGIESPPTCQRHRAGGGGDGAPAGRQGRGGDYGEEDGVAARSTAECAVFGNVHKSHSQTSLKEKNNVNLPNT